MSDNSSQHKITLTYWTFTAIAVVFIGLLGYVIGYSIRSAPFDTISSENASFETAGVAETVTDQQIIAALYPVEKNPEGSTTEGEADAVEGIYAFTGKIDSITETNIEVHHEESSTAWRDVLDFTLLPNTVYVDFEPDTANRIGSYVPQIENPLNQSDLQSGDIVTVYTRENMRNAEIRTVVKIQRITN